MDDMKTKDTVVDPPAASAEAQTEYVLMPRKFTAENGAKHALIGELYETFEAPCIDCSDEDCELCNGAGFVTHRLEISWSVMKEIYNKAVEVLSIPCPPASSSTPALREVTDEDVRIAGKAYNKTGNKPTVGTHEEGIRAALESFRARLSTAQGVEARLWDSQWVNIVNHADCWKDYSKERAVNDAVEMAEKAMAKNIRDGFPPAKSAPETP